MPDLLSIYKTLHTHFGPQGWWPADPGPLRQWEVCVGAILTQNTNWKNVEKALVNLKQSKALSPYAIAKMRVSRLENLIRPSGFYKQKAKRLKEFAKFFLLRNSNLDKVTREDLLAINGIGRETADSILLYACGKPYFVIDTYTRRLLAKFEIAAGDEDYDELRTLFETNLPPRTKLYNEYHALIVALGKGMCKDVPCCGECSYAKLFL
jgi:endonuclease-3 related protein